jgi:16S rRNA (adenine1518-N6/adenine1519-N6)-dimethyltransferase
MSENLFDPEHLKKLCVRHGLSPSKKYGQNFLIDKGVIDRIISAADLKSTDRVVEVGPGFGVLTLALAAVVREVRSFEIEKKIESYWVKEIKRFPNIEIMWGNVLRADAVAFGISPYKVVANLPYQITSAVLQLFLTAVIQPDLIVVMVQKEVGERICAKPGEFSILALTANFYGQPEYLATVPRSSFWPIPGVDSAVIRIITKKVSVTEKEFFEKKLLPLIKIGFSNRRKLLLKNLRGTFDKEHAGELSKIFAELGLSPLARAQELSLEQWQDLGKRLLK